MRVAVIGAGPAGMTAALELVRGGAEVDVFEAHDRVGGLARSLDLWGHRVDLGPHRFFSTDGRVNRLWLGVVGDDYVMVDRLTRIYYGGRFYHYPLRPLDVARNLGLANTARCLASYLVAQPRAAPESPAAASFEDWVTGRFGRRLFETFFRSYSEKLWGISCQQLSADFAAQRIKKFSLAEAVRSALVPSRAAEHATLVDRFAYPRGGTGSVYERMAELVRAAGGRVHLRAPVRRVQCDGPRVQGIELADGRRVACDEVVSTMPLSLLVHGLGDLPPEVRSAADALEFRHTVLVYLHVAGRALFSDQWLYVHAPELAIGRVTNFANWGPRDGDAPGTVLAAEFWCGDEDVTWSAPDEALIQRAERELRSTGLLADAPVLAGHVERIRRCYPVYRRGYRRHVETLVDYLRGFPNLTAIGRYGAFKYNSQDHSILMGLLAAENLLRGASHDLWAVNTDYGTYQESTRITETGLVSQRDGAPAAAIAPAPAGSYLADD